MKKTKISWLGTWPAKCDDCGRDVAIGKFFVDCYTSKFGCWALLCQTCFVVHKLKYHASLGLGKGQMFDSKTVFGSHTGTLVCIDDVADSRVSDGVGVDLKSGSECTLGNVGDVFRFCDHEPAVGGIVTVGSEKGSPAAAQRAVGVHLDRADRQTTFVVARASLQPRSKRCVS